MVDKVAHEQYGNHVTNADVLYQRHALGQARYPAVGGRHRHGGGGGRGRRVPESLARGAAAAVPVRPDGGRGVTVPVAAREQRAGIDESLGLVHPAQRAVVVVVELLLEQRRPAGRAAQERDGRRVSGRRQPEQVVHQTAAVGAAVPAADPGPRARSDGGPVAAVADAVPYTGSAAAGHGGYFGHARRQVGGRVDQQRVGALPAAGAAERGGRGGHQGQGRVQHQGEHGVPAVGRRRARVRLRDQRGRANAGAHRRQAGQVVEQQRPAAGRHGALAAPEPSHQRQRGQGAGLHGVRGRPQPLHRAAQRRLVRPKQRQRRSERAGRLFGDRLSQQRDQQRVGRPPLAAAEPQHQYRPAQPYHGQRAADARRQPHQCFRMHHSFFWKTKTPDVRPSLHRNA